MAGETAKTPAICLRISPWSRTSHVVSWLTPSGRIATSVKGAVRPKSAFLGQYDLNYTCEIVHYARERAGIHALRECSPLEMRERLRGDWRALVAAEHFRTVAGELCPQGPEAADWFSLLGGGLDALAAGGWGLERIVWFETEALGLAGLPPAAEARGGFFALGGERRLPVPPGVADCISAPLEEKNPQILLDAARAIGVFYRFHLDRLPDTRRHAVAVATTQKGN